MCTVCTGSLVIDVLLHLGLKLSASLLQSRRLIHLLYRRILPASLVPGWRVTDRSDRQLLMRHDLFRHLEMEVFVRRARLGEALELVGEVLQAADEKSWEVSATTRGPDRAVGAERRVRGTAWLVRAPLPDLRASGPAG